MKNKSASQSSAAIVIPSHYKVRCPSCEKPQGDPLSGGSWSWKKEHIVQCANSGIKLTCSGHEACGKVFTIPKSLAS